MAKNIIIKCCNCGAEYLPAEIFLPNDFLGKPNSIEKDINGRIINFFGSNMNMFEKYICDYCGERLNIEASVKFYTSVRDKNKNKYKNNYRTQLTKPSLFLQED